MEYVRTHNIFTESIYVYSICSLEYVFNELNRFEQTDYICLLSSVYIHMCQKRLK